MGKALLVDSGMIELENKTYQREKGEFAGDIAMLGFIKTF